MYFSAFMDRFTLQSRFWIQACKIAWIVSLALIVYLCLTPDLKQPMDAPGLDKVYHGLAYVWLALLPQLAFSRNKTAVICSLAMIGLGVLLELVQGFIPGRFFSGADITANTLGVGLGFWLGMRLRTTLAV